MPLAMLKALPLKARKLWEEVYNKNKDKGKEKAAKIAWGAVKKGWKKKGDKWTKKKASEIKKPNNFFGQFNELILDHGERTSVVQLMKVGKWHHPIYGDFEITSERLERFKQNFDDGVRKAIAVDIEHKSDEGAVGWFKEVYTDGESLFAVIEWTNEGINLIQEKKYRFFSPEFADIWVDPATEKQYRDVLIGGALTNRPFFQELEEVILSEKIITKKFSNNKIKKKVKKGGEKVMTKKEIIKKLSENPDYKLPKDADEKTKKVFSEIKAEMEKKLDDGKKKSKAKQFSLVKSFSKLGISSYSDLKRFVEEVKQARKERIRNEIKKYVLPKALKDAVNFAFSLKPKAYKEYLKILKKQSVVKLFTELGHNEIVQPSVKSKAPEGVDDESFSHDQRARKYMKEHPEEFKNMSENEAYRKALYKTE